MIVLLVVLGLVAASCGRSDKSSTSNQAGGTSTTASAAADKCKADPPKATEVGVSADKVTIEVMADVGSSLAPGLFQGNHDALTAFQKYINDNGGIACRQLEVKLWDSKLNADESKNGLIDACSSALAMVGNNALFNPDMSAAATCKDKAGAVTGLPDLAALANDVHQQCNPTSFIIQGVAETCPVTQGQPRPLKSFVGTHKWYLQSNPGLHGIFMVPGDLPTTVQSSTYQISAAQGVGVKWDAVMKVSGRDAQAAFTPRIQTLKAANGTFVYNGSNDRAMVNIRKEAKAQGLNSVKVWACSLACYTRNMLSSGGTDVEGTYVWMQFLPFEEKSANKELAAYVDSVGADKVDSFGAQAWQAAALFKNAVDKIVAADGPNGITRAKLLDTLKATKDFDANGWMGKKDLKGFSPCFLIMQIKGGKFVRVYPEKVGTFDCNADNIVTVNLDPAAEAAKIK
jgi:ABC-type branched-subunit amino acid transport system substrate-binding protein